MKDLKKPLGTIFMTIGALCFIFGIGLPTLMAPQRGFSLGGYAPVHVILMGVGTLIGVLGLAVLLSQTSDE